MVRSLYFLVLFFCCVRGYGSGLTLSLGALTGTDLNIRNMMSYDVISNYPGDKTVRVQGKLQFRNTRHSVSYTAEIVLRPGVNHMAGRNIRLQYSSPDLQRLLESGMMPAGAYEYCVTLSEQQRSQEGNGQQETQDCVFGNNDELFIIELDYPEDGAQIKEFTPQLVWLVNSPLAGQLQYRVKVAEQQPKQSKIAAIQRNNFVLDYKYHTANALSYPVTGRPLRAGQPYVWTVDAYYNNILVGTAAPWTFTIVTDSVEKVIPFSRSYYDFAGSRQAVELQVSDTVKLKYNHTGGAAKIAYTVVLQDKGEEKDVYNSETELVTGWNYKDLVLQRGKLKHNKPYLLRFSIDGKSYKIPFRYYNINKL